MTKPKITLLGGDALLKAVAFSISEAVDSVYIWQPGTKQNMAKKDVNKAKSAKLPENVQIVSSFDDACKGADIIIPGNGSYINKAFVDNLGGAVNASQIVVHMSRAVFVESGRPQTFGQLLAKKTLIRKIGVLSMLSSQKELMANKPAGMLVSSKYKDVQTQLSELFKNRNVQVFNNNDIVGVELAGALSGIYAFAAGIAAGLRLRAGLLALLSTRGLAEAAALGMVCGASAETFSGLSWLGNYISFILDKSSVYFKGGKAAAGLMPPTELKQNFPEFVTMFRNIKLLAASARRLNIPMPIMVALERMLAGKIKPETLPGYLTAISAGKERDFTIDSAALNLPVPRLQPQGRKGE